MKVCKKCKKTKIYERNGIATSKICWKCKEIKVKEKKEKYKLSQKYIRESIKKLHARAWRLFSEWLRRKEADWQGNVKCYTCGKIINWKLAHAGHYLHGKLDFDIRNIHVQGACCNTYRHGNLAEYGIKLAQEIGAEGMQALRLHANTKGNNYSREELEAIIVITEKSIEQLSNQ